MRLDERPASSQGGTTARPGSCSTAPGRAGCSRRPWA